MNTIRNALMFLMGVVFTAGLLTVGQATVAAVPDSAAKTGQCVGTFDANKLSEEEYRQIYQN